MLSGARFTNGSRAALWVVLAVASSAFATPQIIRVDGSVFDNTGIPSTGSKDIQIKLYSASTGGSALWTSSVYNTTVASGRFSINLDGATLAPYLAALGASGTAYFEVVVDTGTANGSMDTPVTVTPRIRSRGTAFALTASSADALYGVTTTTLELNRLAGVTTGVQTQLNAKVTYPSGGADGQVLKFNAGNGQFYWAADAGASGGVTGPGAVTSTNAITRWADASGTSIISSGVTIDNSNNVLGIANLSITGATVSGLTADRVLITTAGRALSSSANVDSTELSYLDGVTSALDLKVNRFTATEAGYIAGVTSGLQGQINTINTSVGYLTGVTSSLAKANMFTLAEAGYLAGVTSSIGNKLNLFTVTDASFLSGLTANVQTQLNASGVGGKLNRGADTMTGSLGLEYANVTPNRVAYVDASRILRTDANVDSTELGFLDGVTTSLATKLNPVTTVEVGYLTGTTAALQTQINTLNATAASVTGKLDKVGGSMSGPLTSGSTITSTGTITGNAVNVSGASSGSRFAMLDSSKNIVSSASTTTDTEFGFLAGVTSSLSKDNLFTAAEASYLSGVTSALGLKVNRFTTTEAGYIAGVTNGIQAQINTINTSTGYLTGVTSSLAKANMFTLTEAGYLAGLTANVQTQLNASGVGGKLNRGADTMTGSLGLDYTNVTPNRVAYVDASRILRTDANVDSTELGYLDGVTSTLSKVNSFTATEATYLAGVTSNLGSKVNQVTNAEMGYLAGVTSALNLKVNRFTATEAGYLAGVTSSLAKVNSFTAAEAAYLGGATANLQSQLNTLNAGGGASGKVDRTGDTMSGALMVPATMYATTFDTTAQTSAYSIGGAPVLSIGTGFFSFNTFVGVNSGIYAAGQYNSHLGLAAGAYDTGTFNTILGSSAGTGTNTGGAGLTGSANLIAGALAGTSTSTGSDNVMLGYLAGFSLTTGVQNVVIGRESNVSSDASYSVGIGYRAVVNGMSAVQLGVGTNSTPYSLQFLSYNFLDSSGNATFNSINSTISSTELSYLDGLTGNIQSQLSGGTKLNSTGGTMSGKLGLNYTGVTVNTLLSLNASREVTSLPVSTTEAGYLTGVTQALQTQLNAKMSTTTASTLTGNLGLNYTNVTPDRVAYVDGSRILRTDANVDSTELSYLDGVTSSLSLKVNRFTSNEASFLAGVTSSLSKDNMFTLAEAGYIAGVTNSIQTQLNTKMTSTAATTMTGSVGLNYTNVTPDRVAYVDGSRILRTDANVDSTELSYLDSVTSSLTKVNSFTATEATYLAGVTSALNLKVNRFTATEAGYLAGVTAAIQTQLNSLTPMNTSVITASAQASVSSIYVTNSASLLSVTLPAACAVGDRIKVVGVGTGGWKIVQNAGDYIDYAGGGDTADTGSITTAGTGGYLQSVNSKAAVELTCRVANDAWSVTASDGAYTGNFTVAGVTATTATLASVTVPANVRRALLKVWGAGGGGGGLGNATGGAGGAGGGGAYATATIDVEPGEVLAYVVGGGGAGGGYASLNSAGGGGAGGGFTAIWRNGADILVIAGGGGGGGGGGRTSGTGGAGAPGNSPTATSGQGGNGTAVSGGYSGTVAGAGASSAPQHRGGSYCGGWAVLQTATTDALGGTASAYGCGGNGEASRSAGGAGGGGGGGGFFGGGGGGTDGTGTQTNTGGGGGGGSSRGMTGTSGSGATPGNNGDSDYGNSSGTGGAGATTVAAGTAGTAGRVIIRWQ